MKVNFKSETFDVLIQVSQAKKIPITKLVETIVNHIAADKNKIDNLIEEEKNAKNGTITKTKNR
ncbi:hypothetical protein PXW27_12820 [Klebsiella pneumoniae]|uniref:hypothetical protein n=1 Tax=Klebsiella pneumoniae TaxID=573 RepID=UPI001D9A1F73|nr:hypothetical protein [Klebsiella pneumoniae]MCB8488265.1 hypothetical protein [Klebsiella pneumoniae]MDE4829740.1 hypothetical protein [Klebsiella pneumoniae]